LTDQSTQFPRFYVTAPSTCPYRSGNVERKVFTELKGNDPEGLHEALAQVGFRRSQDIVYRPTCEDCNACISVRIPVQDFIANRTQKRLIKKNNDLHSSEVPNIATREQYQLLSRYLENRHPEGGMTNMSFEEYADMVQSSPIRTHLVEYRLPPDDQGHGPTRNRGQLIAVCLTDQMQDGLSLVYSFFDIDPKFTKRSLGTYMILEHIATAEDFGLPHVYLGYWVDDSPKMAYKASFTPLETLTPHGWRVIQTK
tara:strand:- start:2484 stop:3245 length:762 start_codon:yes stop_codon:yes gene_type:complete